MTTKPKARKFRVKRSTTVSSRFRALAVAAERAEQAERERLGSAPAAPTAAAPRKEAERPRSVARPVPGPEAAPAASPAASGTSAANRSPYVGGTSGSCLAYTSCSGTGKRSRSSRATKASIA